MTGTMLAQWDQIHYAGQYFLEGYVATHMRIVVWESHVAVVVGGDGGSAEF